MQLVFLCINNSCITCTCDMFFFKPLDFRSYVIAVTSITYSLVYEVILGEYYGLYYYINEKDSIIYIVLAGIILYPALNIIYVLFLPKK